MIQQVAESVSESDLEAPSWPAHVHREIQISNWLSQSKQ